MELLLTYTGIGPALAEKILKLLVKYKLPHATEVQTTKSLNDERIYKLLPVATRADLKYHPTKKVPHKIISEIQAELKKIIKAKHMVAGSFRREKPFSRDIDIVVCDKNVLAKLPFYRSKRLYFGEPYAAGPSKISTFIIYTGTRYWTIKTDIFMATVTEFPAMSLFATGSAVFNIRMRALAKKRGYLLNQTGIFKDDVRITVKSELDIFKILGMTYHEPVDRV